VASRYPYNRYIGYLDNESEEQRKKKKILGRTLTIAGVGAASIATGRYLIQSGTAQTFLDEWVPKLHAGALTLGRAPASRRSDETWAEAFRRSYEEELSYTSTQPRYDIEKILEQRTQYHHDLTTTTRRRHIVGRIKGIYGPETADAFSEFLTQQQLDMPTYLESVSGAVIRRDLTSLFGENKAAIITNVIMSGRQYAGAHPETLAQLDKVMAAELARRKPSPPVSTLHRALGIRPMTIRDYLQHVPDSPYAEDLRSLSKTHSSMRDAVVDPSVFITTGGELYDRRRLSRFFMGLLDDVSQTMPGKILQTRLIHDYLERPFLYRIESGQEQPFVLEGRHRAGQDYMVVGGRLVLADRPNVTVADNVTLMPGVSSFARMARHMVGTTPKNAELSVIGKGADKLKIRQPLDLGNQDQPSVWDKLVSAYDKYEDDVSTPNVMQKALTGVQLTDAEAKVFLQTVRRITPSGFSEQVLHQIEASLPEEWSFLRGNLRLRTDADVENVLRLFDKYDESKTIIERMHGDTLETAAVRKVLRRGEYINLDYGQQRISGALVEKIGAQQLRAIIGEAQKSGKLTLSQARQAYDVINRSVVEAAKPTYAVDSIGETMTQLMADKTPQGELLRTELARLSREHVGTFTAGDTVLPQNLDSGRYIAVRKGTSLADVFALTKAGNMGVRAKQYIKQYGAGRQNLQDVTLRTFLPYYFPERVNEALSTIGLALGPQSLGSTPELYKNLLLKRFLPAYAGAKYASYFGWELGKFTGLTADQRFYRARAARMVDRAKWQDRLGITQYKKGLHRSMPGLDVAGDIPVVGASFRTPRSKEETIDWLRYGEEPVREGAHWLLSSQPWRGGRISYWKPNWYRLGVSTYKMTDTLYGSAEEYWAHQFIPTPRYPFAPLHAIMDPYWLESKHKKDRPYPMSGPLVSDEFLFGPAINATLGLAIKPRRRYHEAEMRKAKRDAGHGMREQRSFRQDIDVYEHMGGYNLVFQPSPWYGADAAAGAKMLARTGEKRARSLSTQYLEGSTVVRATPAYSSMHSTWAASIQADMERAEHYARIARRRSERYRKAIDAQIHSSMRAMPSGKYSARKLVVESNKIVKSQAARKRIARRTGRKTIPGLYITRPAGAARRARTTQPVYAYTQTPTRYLTQSRRRAALPSLRLSAPKYGRPLRIRKVTSKYLDLAELDAAFEQTHVVGPLVPVRATTALQPLPAPRHSSAAEAQARNIRHFMGAWGWGLDILGGEKSPQLVYADAGSMVSYGRAYAESGIGGGLTQLDFGMLGLSQAYRTARRFYTKRPGNVVEYNPLRNAMPEWLPGQSYMLDLQHGDPFAQLPFGEARLPGEGYKKVHPLYPDVDDPRYGWFTRYAILADVAPWSDEYRLYSKIAAQQREFLPDDLQKRLADIRKQVAERKKKYDLHPYQFVGAEQKTRTMKATIADFVDPSAFMIVERPGEVFRTAGVRMLAERPLAKHLSVGQQVEIAIPDDVFSSGRSRNKDMYRSIPATIYTDAGFRRRNLNYELLQKQLGTEREDDWSGPGIRARFSGRERARGQRWERFAHLNIPGLHRKFLPIDSPHEYFERRIIYGKEYTSWNKPISDLLGPTLESYAQKPLLSSAALSAGTGAMIGGVMLGSPVAAAYGAIATGALGGTMSLTRSAAETATRRTWVPARIKKKWRVSDYFDALKYVKYKGVYEYAARQAKRHEGVDVQQAYARSAKRYKGQRHAARIATRMKRQAAIVDDKASVETANMHLKRIQADKQILARGGPWTQMAVTARRQYETTLYGVDLSNPQAVIAALPPENRQFYKHFVDERDKKKRKRILGQVSPLERRVYQHAWGMKVDPLPTLPQFFSKNKIPGPGWAGWHPAVDLDLVKANVVRNEGLDMHDFGIYATDVIQSQMAPGISRPFKPRQNVASIRSNITKALSGAGLRNVRVEDMPIVAPRLDMDFDINLDYEDEVEQRIKAGLWF
jgi:hypothetical protein